MQKTKKILVILFFVALLFFGYLNLPGPKPREDVVLGMTFSEFGRRIKANDSTGTDHGTAAPLFVFGNCVNSNILGNNPTINATVGNDEGVAMQYDFRSIYASILIDWFDIPSTTVSQFLFNDFQKLPIIEGCAPTATEDYDRDFSLSFIAAPNPAVDFTYIMAKFQKVITHLRLIRTN